jgi:hypothetical protein
MRRGVDCDRRATPRSGRQLFARTADFSVIRAGEVLMAGRERATTLTKVNALANRNAVILVEEKRRDLGC